MQTIKKLAVSAATIGLMISPFVSLATNTTTGGNSSTSQGRMPTNNFCTKINDTSSQLNNLLTKLADNRGKIRTTMLQNLSDRKTKRAAEVQSLRDAARTKFADHINSLGSKATTDAQKAAIAAFKVAVLAAQATRKQAVDAAVSAYQTAAQQTITDRENKVKNAATAFQNAVNAAIAQAKTDCANKVAPVTARQTMYNGIRKANEAFRQVVIALPDGTLIQLAKTRDQAIQAANQAFRQAVEAARQALKAAW